MMEAKHWVAVAAIVATALTAIFAGPWALITFVCGIAVVGMLV